MLVEEPDDGMEGDAQNLADMSDEEQDQLTIEVDL